MWARAESRHARARDLPRRGLEVAGFDPLDRVDDDGAPAVQVIDGERLLAVLLQTGGPADAEDLPPHTFPPPILRTPQREEAPLEDHPGALLALTYHPGSDV